MELVPREIEVASHQAQVLLQNGVAQAGPRRVQLAQTFQHQRQHGGTAGVRPRPPTVAPLAGALHGKMQDAA